jgi:lipopolysaccharide/colanic/teichoic acid biosynthesis glycosyltransferase
MIVQGRPVLFRQQRVGRDGKAFLMAKFRTMTEQPDAEAGSFDPGRQSRSTRFGVVLRRAKLDELPQLWNVLFGDMSLVGPRPEVRRWVQVYPERWARVLTIRPGITDLASIEFRSEEDVLARTPDPEATYRDVVLPRKLDYYERYIAERSFRGDCRILVRSLWIVMRG